MRGKLSIIGQAELKARVILPDAEVTFSLEERRKFAFIPNHPQFQILLSKYLVLSDVSP